MKKRILSFLVVLVMAIGFLPTAAFAIEIYESGDWVYFVDGDYVKINNYRGTDANVVVPAVIDGLNITHIHSCAFYNNDYIESVTISDGIEYIGSSAFSDCELLNEVIIPSSVTHIGDMSLSHCPSLTQIEIPYGVEFVGYAAFYNTPIETIVFPESVTRLDANLFQDSTTLKTVYLPRSVTNIGNYAFSGCDNITKVYYAGNRIEYFNLSNTPECENVEYAITHYTFDINDTVTAEINEQTGKLVITGSGVVTASIPYYLNDLVTDIEISHGITALDREAFRYFRSLKTITLPATITSIGTDAFEYTSKLERVDFGGTLEQYNAIEIGEYNDYFKNADTYCDGVHIHYFDNDADPTCNGCDYVRPVENTTEFAGGFGTEGSPYLIKTKYHLNNVRKYLDAHFNMIADLEFTDADFAEGGDFYNDGAGFEPIGTNFDNSFTGVFDGDGHTVKNLYVNVLSDYIECAGLFGCNRAGTIKNLGVVDSTVSAPFYNVGGIVGYNAEGTITRCYNTGAVFSQFHAGGIVGFNAYGTITNCYNTGTVLAATSYDSCAGGIAGHNEFSAITNCYNTGTISSTISTGGIVGANTGTGIIENCYNIGDVTTYSSYRHTGGIAGYIVADIIKNCYYLDTISRDTGGGIFGIKCTAKQLKQQSTYVGFDFENVWTMAGDECYPYPKLKDIEFLSEHTYDNSCDTTCNCGFTRTITHDHKATFDAINHYKECTVCGDKINVEAHKFINACDTTCVCGFTRTITHTYSNACDTDCNVCGEMRLVPSHVYTNSCDIDCNECGIIRTITHSFGAYVYNNNATTSADGTKTRTCSVCGHSETVVEVGSKLPAIQDTTKIFTDVAQDWYTTYVNYAYTYNIFKGNEDGTFKPLANITRAEFVQVLANITNVNTSNKAVVTKFYDVKSGDWFAPAVKWANDNGIVAGYGAEFKPQNNITREQMCVMIVNYAKYRGISLKVVEAKETFADDYAISSWAKDAVYACQMADIVNGKGGGRFDPAGTGLRVEASVIFTKFHQSYLR